VRCPPLRRPQTTNEIGGNCVRKSRKFRWFSAGGGGRLATFLVGHAILAAKTIKCKNTTTKLAIICKQCVWGGVTEILLTVLAAER